MNLNKIPPNGKVAVIGCGISGLSFSYFLNKLRPDIRLTIFESDNQPGGWIKTEYLQLNNDRKLTLEKGPRTLRGVSDGTLLIVDMLRDLNQENEVEVLPSNSIANKKYLLSRENKIIQVPNSVKTLANFLNNGFLSGIWKGVLQEPFVKSKIAKGEDESVEAFISRRFGSKNLSNNIVSGILHGIYGGDISKLSVRSILPSLVDLEANSGSLIKGIYKKLREKSPDKLLSQQIRTYEEKYSPNSDFLGLSKLLKKYPLVKLKHGLQVLPRKLASHLEQQKNVEIIYDAKIEEINIESPSIRINNEIKTYNHIRSTINTNTLSRLIVNEKVKDILPLHYVSIFLVNIYSRNEILIPLKKNGFGFLVPKNNQNNESLLGIIFDSDIEQNVHSLYLNLKPANEKYNKITLMMGGHLYCNSGIPSNSLNIKAIKNILRSLLKVDIDSHRLVFRDESQMTDKSITFDDNDIVISYTLNRECIPQYNIGYDSQKKKVYDVLTQDYKSHLSLGGMGFGMGVGVPDCVMNSLTDALKIA